MNLSYGYERPIARGSQIAAQGQLYRFHGSYLLEHPSVCGLLQQNKDKRPPLSQDVSIFLIWYNTGRELILACVPNLP